MLFCFWLWRTKAKNRADFWSKFMTCELVILNILQPTILNTMFQILACQEIDEKLYIVNNLDYECYDLEHSFYAYFIAIPSLILWGLLYPMLNFIRLWRYRYDLHLVEFRKKFGVLYNFYRSNCFYWEFFILYKKYVLVVIITYLQIDVIQKSLIALLWISVMSNFLNRLSPFVTKEINNIAVLADLVIINTLIFGLFSCVTDQFLQELANLFIFAMNCLFLAGFYVKYLYQKKAGIQRMFRTLSSLKKKRLPYRVKKILTRGKTLDNVGLKIKFK